MAWYQWIACFFAGALLSNAVPHFVSGISGNRFPTPFAHPPGRGLSSPTVNAAWALLNLALGCWLFRFARIAHAGLSVRLVFFAGIAAMTLMLSVQFQKKYAK
jgi:hypothetical protein